MLLLILAITSGCVSNVGTSDEGYHNDSQIVIEDDKENGGSYSSVGSGDDGHMCTSQIIEYWLPDGSSHTLTLPGWCKELYFDHGDPPPEEEESIHLLVEDPFDSIINELIFNYDIKRIEIIVD